MPAALISQGSTVPNGGTTEASLPDRAAITFADPSVGSLSVLFFMGANGMGKTTTAGKVAYRLQTQGGQKVLLAAADTFRYRCCHCPLLLLLLTCFDICSLLLGSRDSGCGHTVTEPAMLEQRNCCSRQTQRI